MGNIKYRKEDIVYQNGDFFVIGHGGKFEVYREFEGINYRRGTVDFKDHGCAFNLAVRICDQRKEEDHGDFRKSSTMEWDK